LWRALRKQRRQALENDLVDLAKAGLGLSRLKRLEERHKGRQLISSIRDTSGHLCTNPDEISEAFATFYEELFEDVNAHLRAGDTVYGAVKSITEDELVRALKKLKNGKTGAEDGLVAEMLKTSHKPLIAAIVSFFNQLLRGDQLPPPEWRNTMMKVLFKKGDALLLGNYRPISIIPVMAKLFSTVLYARIAEHIDSRISEEQFGFRRGRGCSDAVHTMRMIIEKSAEWGEELWVATLDVAKAFDTVTHTALFDALIRNDVEISAVNALRTLYMDMQAYVSLPSGASSRSFALQRGVRQGDPLSPILFNLVLDGALAEVSVVWKRRGYGTNIGQTARGERITHVAFADDQTLVARSWLSMQRMVLSLKLAIEKRGLLLHPTKCQINTNLADFKKRGDVTISRGFSVRVLEYGQSLTLLGTSLALEDVTGQEIPNRISAGWRTFWSLKSLLLNSKVSLRKRLQLFDRTVGSCVTWCSESWALRDSEAKKLQASQRAMLRRVVAVSRKSEEGWIDWIRRATAKAVRFSTDAGVRDWLLYHYQRRWDWLGHVSRRPPSALTWRTQSWRDHAWCIMVEDMGLHRPLRPSRRRWMKLEDPIRRFCAEQGINTWEEAAADRDAWSEMKQMFASWARGGKGSERQWE